MPFGLRPEYLLVLLVVALLFFGPKRIPEMGSAIGKTIKEFQRSMREPAESKDAAGAVPPAAEAPKLASPTTAASEIPTSTLSSTVSDPVQQ